jgi:hypothetical protein
MKFVLLKYPLIVFLSVLPLFSVVAQSNDSMAYYVYYNSTGAFTKTNDQRSLVFNNIFKFSMHKKIMSFHTSNSWLYGKQSDVRINNDFSSAIETDLLKNANKIYYWALATFDKSFSLNIHHRFQVGAGLGWTAVDNKNILLVLSDGLIYEQGDLADNELGRRNYSTWRNSFRIKYRWDVTEVVIVDGTGFFQPSLSCWEDQIIKSTTTMAFKIKKWLSLTTAVTYNKISITDRENLLVTYGIILENYF